MTETPSAIATKPQNDLKRILDLPEQVRKSEFVVKIAEAVADPVAILSRYAVTGDIANAYDTALSYVKNALADHKSEASYIHGSFGSGKSHFMAILSLILQGDTRPFDEPELHRLKVKHDWLGKKNILTIQLNMIGASSTEAKVFAAYLEAIAARHPGAPVPPIFEDQALFDNAGALRKGLGDEKFFATLNQGQTQTAHSGWGKKQTGGGAWDGPSFEAAVRSTDPAERARLFSALTKTLFPAFAKESGSFLALDPGLAVLTEHAKSLGYDAVVLFLDELILWLASRAADQKLVSDEVQKLAKLVDSEKPRAIPVVSFIARQRDLVDMVGEQYAGRDAQNLRSSLAWWEGRVNTITLQDKNLPTIVEKRVVRPRDEAAKQTLDDAFDKMRRGLGGAWQTLLGNQGDERAFRQVYPFSPALIEALIGLSNCLQRERTSLKVLMELLVDHLEDFRIGQTVPVGDLFDALAGGEEPLDGAMKDRFRQARDLYQFELLPKIQERNGTGTAEKCQRLRPDHPVALGCSNCAEKQCRTDNRLIKTLILAELVPQVPVLKDLTARRLVELNHGSLRAPVPGDEANQAARRLRHYAGEVGNLRVEEGANPVVKIVLEAVQIRPILDASRNYDAPGARRRMLQEVLYEAFGVDHSQGTVASHKVTWRGSRRVGSIHFGNVREMENLQLRCTEGDEDFRVIVDYPFDDDDHGPREDEERLFTFRETQPESWTMVLLPSFFTDKVKRDLGELVIMARILEDPKRHLSSLRLEDQQRAREQLEHQRSQKRQRIRQALETAYGLLSHGADEWLDPEKRIDKHVFVLAGSEIRGLSHTVMDRALGDGIAQLLDNRYPRHPRFVPGDTQVSVKKLERALSRWKELCESERKRIAFGKGDRAEVEVLAQLEMVDMTESSVMRREPWLQAVRNALLQEGIEAPTVRQLKRKLLAAERGILPEVADLEVLAFAVADAREVRFGGRPLGDVRLGKLPDDAELLQARLAGETAWQAALDRAGALFGISIGGRARTPANQRAFAAKLEAAREQAMRAGAMDVDGLLSRRADFGGEGGVRWATARAVALLMGSLDTAEDTARVESLAAAEMATSLPAMARHVAHAARVRQALDNDVNFNVLASLRGVADVRAAGILAKVRKVLERDELNEELGVRIPALVLEAQRLLAELRGPAAGPDSGSRVVVGPQRWSGNDVAAIQDEMAAALAEHPGATLEVTWSVIEKK